MLGWLGWDGLGRVEFFLFFSVVVMQRAGASVQAEGQPLVRVPFFYFLMCHMICLGLKLAPAQYHWAVRERREEMKMSAGQSKDGGGLDTHLKDSKSK